MHSSTLATILRQVEKNLPFEAFANEDTTEAAEEEPSKKGVKGKKKAAPTQTVDVQ